MKTLSTAFFISAVILSDIMCAVIAYNYCNLLWGIKYAGYSAPAETAFLTRREQEIPLFYKWWDELR